MILRRLPSRAQGLFHSHQTVPLPRFLATKGPQSSSSSSSSSTGTGAGSGSTTSGSINNTPVGTAPKQRARDWFIVGASGSIAVGGAYWYLKEYSTRVSELTATQQPNSFSLNSSFRTAFAIPVRSSSDRSQVTSKIINSLLPEEVNARLRANEKSTRVERPPGSCIVERYETNFLASNDPIEDRKTEVIVERDRAVEGVANSQKGDLGFFAVMDGHAGWDTSTLLSNKVSLKVKGTIVGSDHYTQQHFPQLIAFVALELDKVIREAGEYGEIAKTKAAMPAKLWRLLFAGPGAYKYDNSISTSTGLDGDSEIVKRAIAKAFRGLDKEIVNTPVELLKEYELSRDAILGSHKGDQTKTSGTRSLSSLAQSIFPISQPSRDMVSTVTQKSAHETMLPAMSGSCALLTYVDSARGDVYVACTGDSRAVAGWWDHDKQQWQVEALSKDQTGRNLDEVKRMKSEHPASESEQVIMRGRVLGGLEPTRAFGDARYKWDRNLQDRLYDAFLPGGKDSVRGAPRGLLTPPYVTAEPVVEYRRVTNTGSRELKFLIMATDGLWDMLSNEEAVGLVATHLSGFRGVLGASDMQRRCFESGKAVNVDVSSTTETQHQVQQQTKKNFHPLNKKAESTFSFEDENLATHLTRNALGGADWERVSGLLAIPAPHSRRYRDDITINVLLFNTRQQQAAHDVKAKL